MSKLKAFTYGPEFQGQMLALMTRDLSFCSNVFSALSEDLLYSEAHKWLFKEIKEKFNSTGKLLTMIETEDHLKFMEKSKRRLYLGFAKEIFNKKIEDEDYIKIQVTDYAQRTMFIDVFKTAQTF